MYKRQDNNWWCGWEPVESVPDIEDTLASDFGDQGVVKSDWYGFVPLRKRLLAVRHQSFVFRNMDDKEHKSLAEAPCAPKLLTTRVIAWVEDNGPLSSREGQAEALADAVAATHWGGGRLGHHGDYSRQAYLLLHKLFADSDAAKRTRYWFN